MSSQPAQRNVLFAGNDTKTVYPRDNSLQQIFELQEKKTPEATALVFSDGQLTYGELNSRANQVANYLKTVGVGPGVLVGICMERSAQAVAALLAILKAGGAYLPLDPTYPIERLEFMISDARVPVVLTTCDLAAKLPLSKTNFVLLDALNDKLVQQSAANLENLTQADDLAYVIYTSGSTGQPKGICIPHRAVCRLVLNTNYIAVRPNDRIAQASNTSFDAATFEIWGALLNGACSVGVTKELTLSPRQLVAYLSEQEITILFLTTALFNQVAREIPSGFASLRDLLFGGEAVDPEMVRRILEYGPPERLLHVYGPTENTTFSSWYLIENVPENAETIPIGRAISNTEILVLNEQFEPIAPGTEGELYIGGDGLARGYLNRPQLTSEKFIANPFGPDDRSRLYKTGDVGRLLADGNIEFVGRLDNQVKLRGFRIELEEIEAVLTRHPNLSEAVVLAHEECGGDKSLIAYVVGKPGKAPALTELRSYLLQHLPDYMMPARFAIVPSLPLNPNGKIDRSALPGIAPIRPNLETPYVEPAGGLEQAIAKVWREVLRVETVGVHDNFFELGGHSLSIAQVHHKLGQLIGADTSVTMMFQYPTVSSLAQHLNGKLLRTEQTDALDPIRDRATKQRRMLSLRKNAAGTN